MKPSHDAQNHASASGGQHTSGNVERGSRQGQRGRECNAIVCVANVRVGSIVCITAVQHWGPLRPSQQTLRERSRTTLRGSVRFRFCLEGYSIWLDYRESMALQRPQLLLRLNCLPPLDPPENSTNPPPDFSQ